MKKNIFIFVLLSIIIASSYAQDNCWTTYSNVNPTFSPVGDSVLINTYGWIYDNENSIEFESSLPYNGWYIYGEYKHKNAFNGFSDSTKYWSLDTTNGIFQLHLFDDSSTVNFPAPDTTVYITGFTTAILINQGIDDFGYGYIETRVKLPIDTTLCSSLLRYEVDNCCNSIEPQNKNQDTNGNKGNIEDCCLLQNQPNPFNSVTVISYFVPIENASALMLFFDMNGKLILTKNLDINADSLRISSGELMPGMYFYTLIVNSVEVDTKKMILTN